jgi:hypothetical protein
LSAEFPIEIILNIRIRHAGLTHLRKGEKT